jgi:hypothetical protein
MEKGRHRFSVSADANGLTNSGISRSLASRPPYRNRADRNPAWPGIGSTDSSADRLPFSGSQRINIRWKAQSLRFPRPKAQEEVASLCTGDHRGPLVFVRLLSQGQLPQVDGRLGSLP